MSSVKDEKGFTHTMLETISSNNNFEQIDHYREGQETADFVPAIALKLGKVAMDFARVERVPRYGDNEPESDVEHSYMLALVAPELAVALELPLDPGKLSQYAIVHDLVELKTGDTPTFSISDQDLAIKHSREQAAFEELSRELPPYTTSLLQQYETQADPEARFIKFVDKLLPLVVDILGNGVEVMTEDYGVHSLEVLQACHQELDARWQAKFSDEFPDIYLAHQVLAELFEAKFAQNI